MILAEKKVNLIRLILEAKFSDESKRYRGWDW